VLTIPTNVTKDGFIFEGWYLDKELTQMMNMTTMPAHDILLYAKWTEIVELDSGVIIAIVICATVVILGIAYILLACFCSACAFHSTFGKINIFNYFECGKNLMVKFNHQPNPDPNTVAMDPMQAPYPTGLATSGGFTEVPCSPTTPTSPVYPASPSFTEPPLTPTSPQTY